MIEDDLKRPRVPSFDRCARPTCEEPCPWEKPSILLDCSIACCSPDCALAVLEALGETPSTIALHDPQFRVDRASLGVDEDATEIWRDVADLEDAERAISELAEIYPARFRPSR